MINNVVFSGGKNLYLESLWLDIQFTAGLKDSHPELLAYFKKNGQHAPRRKDRYWAGYYFNAYV